MGLGVAVIRGQAVEQFQTALDAVQSVRGYQGLVLDSGGVGGLLIGVLERTGGYDVRSIELSRAKGRKLSREFSRGTSPGLSRALEPLRRIDVNGQLDDTYVAARIELPLSRLGWVALISAFFGFLLGGVSYFRTQLEQRRSEWLLAKRISEMSRQIAHDIRSPLGALRVFVKSVPGLSAEQDRLIRSAVDRIQAIAEGLLRREMTSPVRMSNSQNLPDLIEPLLYEKKAQIPEGKDILFGLDFDGKRSDLNAEVDPFEFQRVVSNLLNNAIEAVRSEGLIRIEMRRSHGRLFLIMRDNGSGIPAEVLSVLRAQRGTQGISHGKRGGNGLGLAHARAAVERWAGELVIESEVGKGTSVTIMLPCDTSQLG